MDKTGVIAIIPARGGSKGVPRKNVRMLGGRPLIAHSIEAALQAKCVSRIVVSTDDEEIAQAARNAGAETPFMRPPELAQDHVPVMPVIQDLMRKIDPQQDQYPYVVVLQPTNPFRKPTDIDKSIDILKQGDCDTVLTVSPASNHPYRMRWLDSDGNVLRPLFENVDLYAQRQELPPVYNFNGSIISCLQSVMLNQEVFYGVRHRGIILDEISGFDIDTELDLLVAEQLAARFQEALPQWQRQQKR